MEQNEVKHLSQEMKEILTNEVNKRNEILHTCYDVSQRLMYFE